MLEKSKSITDVQQWPYRIVNRSLEVIPRTLIQNCGGNTIRTLTALRAKHASNAPSIDGDSQQVYWGINGETGEITNIRELEIWEPLAVKQQILKTSIETAILLLRIDDIISGSKKRDQLEKDEQNRKNMAGPITPDTQPED